MEVDLVGVIDLSGVRFITSAPAIPYRGQWLGAHLISHLLVGALQYCKRTHDTYLVDRC